LKLNKVIMRLRALRKSYNSRTVPPANAALDALLGGTLLKSHNGAPIFFDSRRC
jgi:hypothetical protein